jgi:hypothetical protein
MLDFNLESVQSNLGIIEKVDGIDRSVCILAVDQMIILWRMCIGINMLKGQTVRLRFHKEPFFMYQVLLPILNICIFHINYGRIVARYLEYLLPSSKYDKQG